MTFGQKRVTAHGLEKQYDFSKLPDLRELEMDKGTVVQAECTGA